MSLEPEFPKFPIVTGETFGIKVAARCAKDGDFITSQEHLNDARKWIKNRLTEFAPKPPMSRLNFFPDPTANLEEWVENIKNSDRYISSREDKKLINRVETLLREIKEVEEIIRQNASMSCAIL